jgi:2-dehydro-3-deoxy-D-gluconate 5-dehydrogenase
MSILSQFDLSGKCAIVTGCNTGLGQGMAIALAQAGADIIGMNQSEPSQTQSQILGLGRRFLDVRVDLKNTTDIPAAIEKVLAWTPQINILVNNAGIIRRDDAIKFCEKDWDDVMDINLKAVFFLSQAVAKHCMANSAPGKIINVASMLSFQGGIRVPSYTASKSAILGITRLMANEWASHGINVNAIAPGYMATNNTAALRADQVRNSAILDRIPAARWGAPDDLAGAVVFLASRASNYVSGHTLAVDGGWLAR